MASKPSSTKRDTDISSRGWAKSFDDPIVQPGGSKLKTPSEAGEHIAKLPKREHDAPHWQLAMLRLIDAANHGGIGMMAHMAVLRAINHGKTRDPAPRKPAAKKYRIVR
jgi:hypothetical protein